MDYDENNQHFEQEKRLSIPHEAPSSLFPSVLARLGITDESLLAEPQADELIAALDNPDWQTRAAAVRRLGNMGAKIPLEHFVTALNDKAASVRAAAVRALGLQGARVPEDRLIGALGDPDWHVRETAALTLGKLGQQIPAQPLIGALNDKDGAVREAALLALTWIHPDLVLAITPSLAAHLQGQNAERAHDTQLSSQRDSRGEHVTTGHVRHWLAKSTRNLFSLYGNLPIHVSFTTKGKYMQVENDYSSDSKTTNADHQSTSIKPRHHASWGRNIAVALVLVFVIVNGAIWFTLSHGVRTTTVGGSPHATGTHQYAPTTLEFWDTGPAASGGSLPAGSFL